MARKKYFSMNQVPVGTKMIVKETGEEVILKEVQNFPTTFKTVDSKGTQKSYFTYQVDIVDWPLDD